MDKELREIIEESASGFNDCKDHSFHNIEVICTICLAKAILKWHNKEVLEASIEQNNWIKMHLTDLLIQNNLSLDWQLRGCPIGGMSGEHDVDEFYKE